MTSDRVRSFFGVWAPMAIGLFIIVTTINFLFTATLPAGLESWRLVCSAGAFFVGGLLLLSTYGRFAKTKVARGRAVPDSFPSPRPPETEEKRGNQAPMDYPDEPRN